MGDTKPSRSKGEDENFNIPRFVMSTGTSLALGVRYPRVSLSKCHIRPNNLT